MPKVEKVKHNVKVTSEDIPGGGMAKKAGEAMEKHKKKRKKMMDDLFGKKKK
jgi:hypothetical protein